MSTAQDLLIVALEIPSTHPVQQGDLSLALAGAELIDLLEARTLTLDAELIVPAPLRPSTGDELLDKAAAELRTEPPYENVEEWLWRRGSGLAAVYAGALAAQEDRPAPLSFRRLFHRGDPDARPETPRTPARLHATERWNAHDPVLVALAGALGIEDAPPSERTDPPAGEDTDAVETVLASVGDALTELEAVRQRRQIEQDAYDNVWRAP
ncbi:GPP34 family phosphoprotein [Streptomyces sp. J2-1]|uniref:GPP34 family phosphoprotein n=1 Tax=Streptomyces corallincola TaxID=2851888 RepID=UPI001C391E9E|nr:GPP34 family phosphoprotein [Streptomyces corallincola]MBV2353422.1 GPP34 family phosphoprotein [Streptomyces corallincola]